MPGKHLLSLHWMHIGVLFARFPLVYRYFRSLDDHWIHMIWYNMIVCGHWSLEKWSRSSWSSGELSDSSSATSPVMSWYPRSHCDSLVKNLSLRGNQRFLSTNTLTMGDNDGLRLEKRRVSRFFNATPRPVCISPWTIIMFRTSILYTLNSLERGSLGGISWGSSDVTVAAVTASQRSMSMWCILRVLWERRGSDSVGWLGR